MKRELLIDIIELLGEHCTMGIKTKDYPYSGISCSAQDTKMLSDDELFIAHQHSENTTRFSDMERVLIKDITSIEIITD